MSASRPGCEKYVPGSAQRAGFQCPRAITQWCMYKMGRRMYEMDKRMGYAYKKRAVFL